MILIDAKLKRAWKKVNVYPNNIIGFLIFSHGRTDLTLNESGYDSMYDKVLNPRERQVIHHMWKFHLTLDQTAENMDLSRARVQQLEQRALHKLLNTNLRYYSVPYEDYKKALDTIDYLRAYIEEHNMQTRLERFEKAAEEHEKLKTKVDDMGLTVRSRNVLRRNGIDTLGKLIELDKNTIVRFRNLGKHCLEEIVTKVHAYGLKMKWED